MKKHILLFFVGIFSCLQLVAIGLTTNMNPFAYNLSSTLSADQQTLTVKYCLNANARTVTIVLLDGSTVLKEVECTGNLLTKTSSATDPYLPASQHSIDIPVGDMPVGIDITCRIDVTGNGRNTAQVYSQDGTNVYRYKFYRPSSVDIVQDPTSYNYGKVLVVESQHTASTKAGYHSSPMTKTNGNTDKQGAGIYVFNPDLTPRNNTSGTYVFNGKNDNRFPGTEFSPYRVRVSEDGRIFVSSLYKDGNILWEVPATFGEWTTVIGKEVTGTTWVGNSNTSAEVDTDYRLNTTGGTFIAAPSAGLDVRGKGEYLKLLLLCCTEKAFGMGQAGFHTYEYNLGTATTWNQAPSKDFKTNTSLFAHVNTSNVQYDKDGGIWCISYRGTCSETMPGLVHKTSTTTEDCRILRSGTKNAGLRFNKNFTRAIMASGTAGTLYDYDPTNHAASVGFFFNENNIDMSAVGSYLNDFAWDNANNIWAVGASSQEGGTGYVAVYCLAYKSTDIFSTPAPNTFLRTCTPGQNYTVTATANDNTMGSVTGSGTYECGSTIQLTATANDEYRFLNWTVGENVVSEANPYEFIVTKDVEVQANFAPAVFNVTWWNLFQGSEDITEPTLDQTRNSRLWYLFMPYYNQSNGSATDREIKGHVNGNEYNVMAFAYDATPTVLKDDTKMGWLGTYLRNTINTLTASADYRAYAVCLYAFINRTSTARNSSGSLITNETYYNVKMSDLSKFTDAGTPEKWRPYWTEDACDLKRQMNYSDEMPIEWTMNPGPSANYDTYTTSLPTSGKLLNTPAWYKWNTGKPNQLLAWREGDSITGPIVHQVDHDMALYATYVDRHISESQDNTDVIRLMQNSGYAGTPHALTVDRKLQAGMYNTICFPFTVYINDEGGHSGLAANHPLKGSTVLKLIGKDELYDESGEPVVVLNFEQVNKLEAGKPYLIKLAENQGSITQPINFTGVAYDDLTYINGNHTITIDDATISFHAMINPGDIPAESVILVADNRLAVTTASGQMNGLRGYFTINDAYLQSVAKAGRLYLSMKKPVTTSIPVAPEAEQQTQPKVRKIMQNGQIYILRDGKVYDVMGRQL